MLAARALRVLSRTAPCAASKPNSSLTWPFATRSFSITTRSAVRRPLSPTWKQTFHQAQQTRTYRQPFNYQRFQTSRGWLQRWAARPTFYYEVAGIGGVCGGYYILNLEAVPVSGRKRFNVVSREQEAEAGRMMFRQTMQEYRNRILPAYNEEHQMVQRVLNRLVPHSGLQNEAWEIHVIDDPQLNAFVIPGGKVFVFRGILDLCKNDDGLAAVLGHEIAHNAAHHAAERMSLGYVLLPLALLGWVFGGIDPGISNTILNLTLQLPGSRKQEAEADYIGLLMMAESCYDPAAALSFWGRMEAAQHDAVPQFLSTHPSNHNRLEKIREWLPAAETKRDSSGCGAVGGFANDFRGIIHTPQWTG